VVENLLKKAKRKIDQALANEPDSDLVVVNIDRYLQSIQDNFDPRFIKTNERLEKLGIPKKYVPLISSNPNRFIRETPEDIQDHWNELIVVSQEYISDFLNRIKKYIKSKGYEVESTNVGVHGSEYALVIKRKTMQEKYKRLFEMERPTPRSSEKKTLSSKSIELPPEVERNLQKFLRMIDEVIKKNKDEDVLKIPVGRLFELVDKSYSVGDMKRENLIKAGIPDKYLNKDNSLKGRVPLEIFEHWKDLRDLAIKYESEIKRRLKKEATDAGWTASVSEIEGHSTLAGIEHLRIKNRNNYYSDIHLILKKP
jgi:hypothetical protein